MSSPSCDSLAPAASGQTAARPPGGLSIECRQVLKLFPTDDPVKLLRWYLPELSVRPGERVMITGPSGCGKTTLVNLLAGLLKEDSGEITVQGVRVDQLSLAQADVFRGDHLGLVFQSFQLLRPLTMMENLLLGARYGRKLHGPEAHERAEALVREVGLWPRRHYRAAQLSIGEQQRVAVARALINRPAVVLADEPTASLDARNAEAILDLLLGLCEEEGATLLLVTHNAVLAPHFGRCLEAKDWMSTVGREVANHV